jgi:hypothetical protein
MMCPECGKGGLECECAFEREERPSEEELLEKIRDFLPHVELAADMARPQGAVKLAIIAEEPDGGGRITCRFECEEFLKDLRALVGEDAEDAWEEFIEDKRRDGVPSSLCGICGNWGVIDTRSFMRSPAGARCGVLRYCICPNGRDHKKRGVDLELLSRNMRAGVPGARGGPWNGGMPVVG